VQDINIKVFLSSLSLSLSLSLSFSLSFSLSLWPLLSKARDIVAIFGAIANIERQLQLHCLSNDKVIFVIVRAPIT